MADVPDRVPPQELRASDTDRERTAAVLRTAAAEGRLDLGELDERLARTYAAKTYGELEPLTRDLPAGVAPGVPDRIDGAPASGWTVAVLSGSVRKGTWLVPRRLRCLAFWGGACIDLREASFASGEVVINAWAIMGGVTVIVPPEAAVHVDGVGIMGGFGHVASSVGRPGAPRVTVTGLAFWGGVDVRRRPRADALTSA